MKSRVHIEANCYACGNFLFGEAYREALVDRWGRVTDFWRKVLAEHEKECKGDPAVPAPPAARCSCPFPRKVCPACSHACMACAIARGDAIEMP